MRHFSNIILFASLWDHTKQMKYTLLLVCHSSLNKEAILQSQKADIVKVALSYDCR